MNNTIKYRFILIFLTVAPVLLHSQEDGSRIIGGRIKIEHLRYQKSSLGAIKDIDLGFSFNYLKILSPAYYQHIMESNPDSTIRLWYSSYGLGLNAGISGYYNNTDSILMHGTEVNVGPVVRYFTRKNFFMEGSFNILYAFNRLGYPVSSISKYAFLPTSKILGLSFEVGIGYRVILSRNVSLEPIVAYQRKWKGFLPGHDYISFDPYERTHAINFYLSLQFYL